MQNKSHIPAQQEFLNDKVIRTFSHDVKSTELKWHWDEKDRIVKVLEENDWLLQFDDQFPIKLEKNKQIHIKSGVWHRVIKGSTDLKIEIQEI